MLQIYKKNRFKQTLQRMQSVAIFALFAFLSITKAEIEISEFMAINDTTLMDVDGDNEDWIEIHNDSTNSVNLAGWFLTDNATKLDKWRFPSIVLSPDQYLVVFASNKDRRNPRAELHTNFKLSGKGEYLALVQPNGTVVYDFAPEYPAQAPDISYGTVATGVTKLLAQGASASANAPISAAEFNADYAGWNTLGFVENTQTYPMRIDWISNNKWRTGEGTADDQHKLSHGYLDDKVSPYGNGIELYIVNIPFATYRVYGLVASDKSNTGNSYQCLDFQVNNTWVFGGTTPSTNTAYGTVDANSAHNGEPWTKIVPGSVIGNYWTIESNGPRCNIFGSIKDVSTRGSLTGIIIEPTGTSSGAAISIDFADSSSDAFTGGQNIGPLASDSSTWYSTLDRDSGSLSFGSMELDLSSWQSGHTGFGYERNSGYEDLIGNNGDVEALTYNKNASLFVRIPFTVNDTNNLSQLTLQMKYDDGFRAFLNGTEVAADNAPSPAGWNSSSIIDRNDALNDNWTDFDLTAHLHELHLGNNLLAIQGFNSSANSSDLLLLPKLDVEYDVTLSITYLYLPSPGTDNGPGSTTIGPSVRKTTDWVPRPAGNVASSLMITSKVTKTLHSITSVNLHYRTMFAPETIVAMTPIGEDLYTANIPVPADIGAGQMIRWRVEAADDQANKTTDPLYLDPNDYEQYYGTVTLDTSYADSLLPVVEWFVEDYAAANIKPKNGGGTGCSLYYLDRFYDNVFIGKRGGTTAGFEKNSHKLDFNKDNRFTYKEGKKKIKDLRWMQNWSDKTKVHNTMSHETAKRIGAPYHFTFPVRIQRNGSFGRIVEFMENDDDRWLERLGRDPEGALLKMGRETWGEKKTRRDQAPYDEVTYAESVLDNASKNALFDTLNTNNTISIRRQYIYDNMNIPDCLNYLVAANLFSHQDHGHKNYYIYRDTNNTGEWSIWLWDLDLAWGRNWTHAHGYLSDILYADNTLDFNNRTQQRKVYNRIYKAFHESPELLEMYFRRLRTVMDEILQPADTPEQDKLLEARFDYWIDLVDPVNITPSDADLDHDQWLDYIKYTDDGIWGIDRTVREEWARTKLEYMNPRREYLFNENPSALEIFGESAPAMQPATPFIKLETVDFLPASGNAMEEYFTLLNTNNYAVDISGWSVTGGVKHVFAPGTVIPSGGGTNENIGRLYVARQSSAFRAKTSGPSANQFCFVQGGYKGQLSARGESITLFDSTERVVDQFTYAGTPTEEQNSLRISELMYAPTDPTAAELAAQPYLLDTDFEFIELVNIGTTPLDLGGAQFTEGVLFTFPIGFTLAAGDYAIVAANTNAFPLRYGSSATVAGQYDGYLANGGETLILLDSVGEKVLDFTYNNSWYPITDGHDFSLVIRDKNADWKSWDDATSWRGSANLQGSPGATDPSPPTIGGILINEVLTHTDLPQVDTIELYNPEGITTDIGGWFLTDDFTTPKKFRIPAGTTLANNGYILFDEGDFNTDTNLPTCFQLKSTGDEVWLFSANTQSNLTGYVHGFEFGAAQNGVSFGRYITTIGKEHFPAQSALSLGSINVSPKIGPVVVSEIMYHPLLQEEYIELTNITESNVLLYDPLATTNTWHLRNAIDFDFPQGSVLAAQSRLLVVGFDPTNTTTLAAFRAAYGVGIDIPIFGPWNGNLDNDGEKIRLKWPDNPNLDDVPYILAEEIGYKDSDPWPLAADGTGKSLRRVNNTLYGDDPANWQAASPSPGTANPTPDNDPPAPNPATFAVAPIAISDTEISMTATIGSDVRGNHPIEYLFTETSGNSGGTSSAWQTNPSYTNTGLTVSSQYTYTVTLRDSVGNMSTASAPASAIAIGPPTPNPPTFAVAPVADNTTAISMTATIGSDPNGPVEYLFTETSGNSGGTSSTWQTHPSYTDTGLRPATQYTYTVTMRDILGNTGVASAPASAITIAELVIFYSQPLDSDPGWTTEGLWRFGSPMGGGGGSSNGSPDPLSGYTGTKVYGYNLTGNYEPSLPQTHLTSLPIDCSGQFDVHLKFWRWLGVEYPIYDHAYVQVSTNSVDWSIVWENTNVVSDSSWTQVDLDISIIADNQSTVYLRWTMGTTDSDSQFCGWNIDDIELIAIAQDTDSDGMPDAWETTHGLNPAINDAADDADGDRLSNYGEYIAGTDPNNPASVLIFEYIGIQNTNTVLHWQSVAGKNYSLLGSTNLQNWSVLQTNLPAIEPLNTTTVNMNGAEAMFFKIQIE